MKTANVNERSILIGGALAAMKDREFEYGVFDCHLFPADIVKTYTDKDYGESFRGTYSTEKEAYRIIAKHGGAVEFVNALLERQPQPVFHACVGDLMAYKVSDKKVALGVCIGGRAVFLNVKGGFEHRELAECLCSWKVE
jgi:hypothetical protein